MSPSRLGICLSAICHHPHCVSALVLAAVLSRLRKYVGEHVPHLARRGAFLFKLRHCSAGDSSGGKIRAVMNDGRRELPVLGQRQDGLHLQTSAGLRLREHEHEWAAGGLDQSQRAADGIETSGEGRTGTTASVACLSSVAT